MSLIILEVFEEDVGKFICIVKNVVGFVSSLVEFVIKGRYSFYWGCLLRVFIEGVRYLFFEFLLYIVSKLMFVFIIIKGLVYKFDLF